MLEDRNDTRTKYHFFFSEIDCECHMHHRFTHVNNVQRKTLYIRFYIWHWQQQQHILCRFFPVFSVKLHHRIVAVDVIYLFVIRWCESN